MYKPVRGDKGLSVRSVEMFQTTKVQSLDPDTRACCPYAEATARHITISSCFVTD